MFRKLVGFHDNEIAPNWRERTKQLFRLHPIQLTTLLELVWERRRHEEGLIPDDFGHPLLRSELVALPPCILDCLSSNPSERRGTGSGAYQGAGSFTIDDPPNPSDDPDNPDRREEPCRERRYCTPIEMPCCDHLWHHLIYAYLIENTRIYEIFKRVLFEFACGEKFGAASVDTQHWLRNTEELFYRDTPPFYILSITSHIRPDSRANRRNAYYRMFGMDLNHGGEDGKAYPYKKAETANNEFVNVLEKFLYEVWVGIINTNNSSGANPTSDAVIGNLANQLYDMLRARRQYGNLSRPEYWYVSMLSWFHLTLEYNSPIVMDLRAEAASPEQRLFNIAKRVGLPAHAKSEQFFRMAPLLSKLLILIEQGGLNNNLAAVRALYTEGVIEQDIRQIIADWEVTTGRNIRRKDYSNLTVTSNGGAKELYSHNF